MARIGIPTHLGLLDSRYVNITGDTMMGTLTNTVGIILSKIYPSVDSTTAIQFNKADSTTNVVTIDTTNGRVGIGTTGPGDKLTIQSGALAFSHPSNGLSYMGIDFDTTSDKLRFRSNNGSSALNQTDMVIDRVSGNVGIGTTSPTNLLSLGGNSARIFWLERHTTANTAGNTLTITAGGATSGATDKNGGDLLLQGGLSTGTGESGVQLYGCVAGATGTADRTQTLGIQLLGNKLGFFSVTPVVRPTALTTQLTTVTCSAPGTPDYAIADLTRTTPYGFVSADEGQSVLKVIANLQTRVAELEIKLQGLGLLT